MTHPNRLAGIALCALAGLGGYLWWQGSPEVAPDLQVDAPVEPRGETDAAPTTVGAVRETTRRLEAPTPSQPTEAEQREAWQDRAQQIQTELIAAMLSGNAEAIARARAQAESLASTSSRR